MQDSLDPLGGWNVNDVLRGCGNATKDIYGGLYFHIRGTLRKLCQRLHSSARTSFVVSHQDTMSLPELLCNLTTGQNASLQFDRIDCSNIADAGYLGIRQTLATMGPLLKPKTENPHATIVTSFINAVNETDMNTDYVEHFAAKGRGLEVLASYDPDGLLKFIASSSPYDPEKLRISQSFDFFRDNDKLFRIYMAAFQFDGAASVAGVKMKQRNTIVNEWPMRLKKRNGENGAKEEFEVLRASSHNGTERYVEWVRDG